jgi:trigger factor
MKVEVANVSDIERRITVAIPSESVASEIDKAYIDLKKNVRLRGFRPGKAPIPILQKYFKAQVEEDVISRLVKNTYPKALDEVKISPVSQPKIENGVLEKGEDFFYTAVFEIKPDIDVQGYEGLELEKEKIEVTDDDVEKQIQALRNSHAVLKDVEDRAAQKGDCIVFDFDGTVDDRPYPGNKQNDFFLEVADDSFLPGFSEQVTGLKKGDQKTFSLAIPGDYTNKDLAGKTVKFNILMKEIKEKVMPDVDDEFAKDLGEYSGLEDLKDKLKESLTENKRFRSEAGLKEKIFDILIEKNPFEVPKSMVEMQVRNMITDTQQMLKSQELKIEDMGQSVEQLSEQYMAPAERQVRSALLLEAVAEKEGLAAEEEDFEKQYQQVAKQVNQDVGFVKGKVDREMLRPQILERKAIELVISKAIIT